MIFFRKKKPPTPPPAPAKPKPPAKTEPPTKVKSLQEIAHTRVLTAEGWKRSAEKKLSKKK